MLLIRSIISEHRSSFPQKYKRHELDVCQASGRFFGKVLWQVVLRWCWASHCFVLISMERDRGLLWHPVSLWAGLALSEQRSRMDSVWLCTDLCIMGKMTGNLEPSGTVELYICCPQNHPQHQTTLTLRWGAACPRTSTACTHTRMKNEITCCEHPGTDAYAAMLQASVHLFAHAHCAKICVDTRPTPPSSSSHTLITCIITSPSSNNQITGGGKLVRQRGKTMI